ncbi:membrane protein insertase YidC [Abyssibius alkaniclasticus]|uniref:membrane protein insertase YidC n=1 Tax=Abyssibius alkaniclasticus TaxID=2881234 RepID=UPI00236361CA|nr:membrane protein insertase YidC [Abyssibius alkaniclasticus]UPH72585.1 membrane protein insertase YidC [Abyssibius alkaniclasticus]
MEDQSQTRNMILAAVLSLAVIIVWTIMFPPVPAEAPPAPTASVAADGTPVVPGATGTATAPVIAADPEATRDVALARSERLPIVTAKLNGSISLTGGRIDDLHMTDYRETLDPGSDTVTLFSPAGSPRPYYAVYGWAPGAGTTQPLPDANTVWSVESGETLSEDSPVTLVWDNGSGLIFRRVMSVDENYMFDVVQTVENTTDTAVRMMPYGIIARTGTPETIGFYILHEGVVRAQDGTIEEINYSDMPDFTQVPGDGAVDRVEVAENGWIGFTDKYWMAALIAAPGQGFSSVAKYTAGNDTYQTDMRLPVMEVAPGATLSSASSLFAGAKVANTIRDYQNDRGIANFYDSIDWGWFYFLTKPMFWLLTQIHNLVGNMGLAIIGLTFVIKSLVFPLAYKSYVSMSRMKKLQPEMEKLKERVGDDRQAMQKEMMALYKREKVNPASGCLPILVQIPIFFSLYKVLFVTIEMRHAPFFGWIKDLSAPDPSSWLNLFGLLPYDVAWAPTIISIGVFPILMGVTMWMQQKLNPAPTDKTQATIFAWMPWVFMFMLGTFASGLVIYWVANNTLTFLQQYFIMRSQGVKPDIWGNIRKKPATAAANSPAKPKERKPTVRK